MMLNKKQSPPGAMVTRDLPASANVGSNVQITVTVSGVTGDYFAIVREDIPPGWAYVSGGALEGNQVKGFLSHISTSTLTYTLQAPSTEETTTFTGTYQFTDDVDPIPTTLGDTQIDIGGVCVPQSCTQLGYECGTWDDGCGNQITCPACNVGYQCEVGQCVPRISDAVIERDLPASVTVGSLFNVKLQAVGTSGDYFAIARDTFPEEFDYVSGGSLEGAEVKSIISSLTGSTVQYTLQAPTTIGTYVFSGTYQFTDDPSPITTEGETQLSVIAGGCSIDSDCISLNGDCVRGACIGNTCETINKPDGTTCTAGTCKNGVCVLVTCGDGTINAGEVCDGTNFGGQSCQSYGKEAGMLTCNNCVEIIDSGCYDIDESCNSDSDCEAWEECKDGKCEMASWVIMVLFAFGALMVFSVIK